MGSFQVAGKIALVTGGAGGIGFGIGKALLRNKLKGLAIADINEKVGQAAVKTISEEFGKDKAIFVKTDTSDTNEFKNAFQETINRFGYIDILVNNAGILNDKGWQRVVDVNVKGTINGTLLGIDNYLRNHRNGHESLIINIASIAAMEPEEFFPLYSSTKCAILGLSQAYGTVGHYERTKVKVITILPNHTESAITKDPDLKNKMISKEYEALLDASKFPKMQSFDHLGKSVLEAIPNSKTGAIWVVEGSQPPFEVRFPHRSHWIV